MNDRGFRSVNLYNLEAVFRKKIVDIPLMLCTFMGIICLNTFTFRYILIMPATVW